MQATADLFELTLISHECDWSWVTGGPTISSILAISRNLYPLLISSKEHV